MGIPLNNIVTGKYTSGKEYVYYSTNTPYQGYYYEYNNKTYAGQEYNVNSREIVKKNSSDSNQLLNKGASTAVYSVITGTTSSTLSTPPVASIPSITATNILSRSTRFFYKKYNDNIIKETDENGYKSLVKNPIYQTTFIGTYNNKTQTLDQADQQVPGLKIFLAA